jgi:hypothetical protein
MQKELYFKAILGLFVVAVVGIAWLLVSSLFYLGTPDSLMTKNRAANFCLTELHSWCQSRDSMPLNWYFRSLKYREGETDTVSSCMDLTDCYSCQACWFNPA